MNDETETPKPSQPRRRRRAGLWLEFAMIIVGALMALALDDWRENRERDERDAVIMELVAEELKSNREILATGSSYHRDMIQPMAQSVETMRQQGEFALPDTYDGIKPMLITRTAFDLAVNTGVLARIPAPLALSLSQVYERMETSERYRQNVSLATLQSSFNDGVRYLRLQQEGLRVELDTANDLIPLLETAEAAIRSF